MSKFIELNHKEQEQINGGAGVTSIMSAIGKWILEKLGVFDEDYKPLIPY